MERVGKTLKKQSFRKVIIYFLTWCMVFNTSLPAVLATPSGGVFKVGDGTIVQDVVGGDNTVLVKQLESVIEWGSKGSGGIDTSALESLSFSQIQGLSNSAVLNRIMSENVTQFDGTLNGMDMRIFIVNPAGIVFGDGAIINVSQLVASSLDVSNFHDIATDVTRKMEFTDGAAAGSVEIQGVLDASNTGSLYFVGKNVANKGSILCPNGLVVMAAGNEIKLGQPGSSVIVTLADLGDADIDNVVTNNGTVGEDGSPVGKLVLAAGDVWSQAISNVKQVKIASVGSIGTDNLDSIYAYSNGGSDAVATVDIVSGGDVYVDDDVKAEAESDGVNNATATVTVNAGGDVIVDDDSLLSAWALTEDDTPVTSGNLTATVDIDAGKEVIVGEESPGYVAAVAKTGNFAYGDLGDITATVDIDAGKVDLYEGNIAAVAKTGLGSNLNAGEITATVNIDTIGYTEVEGPDVDGDVFVGSYDYYVEELNVDLSPVEAHAEAGSGIAGTAGNVTATVNINAAGMLDVDEGGIQAEALVGYQNYAEAGNLNAKVDIVTGGDVDVYNGYIEALAYPDNSPAVIDDATATVNIDAGKNVFIEDAEVLAEASDGATNTATTNVTANDGAVEVTTDDGYAEVGAYANNGIDNIANVNITAKSQNVESPANAYVYLHAEDYGDVYIGAEAEGASNSNSAAVTINADYDVELYAYDDSSVSVEAWASNNYGEYNPAVTNDADVTVNAGTDVEVRAEYDSDAQIYAEASYGVDNAATVDVTANYGNVDVDASEDSYAGIIAIAEDAENNNTAEVTVTAKRENVGDFQFGNVNVTAQNETTNGNSRAEINSWTYGAGMNNTSTTTINADGDVRVQATNTDQEAGIGAYAGWDDESNAANVIITAGGDVEVTANYSNAYIEADSWYGGTNTAGVDITTNDGRVAVSSYQDSSAWIAAEAHQGDDNISTVTVTTKGQSGSDDDNGDVRLDVAYSSEAWIGAEAESADNSNSATTTINASENVWLSAYDDSTAGIESSADIASENNNANVIVTAGGNVDVRAERDSDADIYAEASDGITNNASVDITAGTDVRAQANGNGSYSFAGIEAEVYAFDGTNTAKTTINAGGKVVARADSGGEVDIDSEASYGSKNKATTTITAGDYVKVKAVGTGLDDQDQLIASNAAIEAEAWDSYNNTANVNITVTGEAEGSHSGMVRVIAEDGGQAGIEALAWNDGDVDDYTDLTVTDVDGDYYGLEGTIQGITNTAKVDIKAKSVEVSADGSDSSAFISSKAGNEIRLALDDYEGDLFLTLGSIRNDADILIATIPDDDGDMEGLVADNGDVLVVAGNSGMAGLDVEATNKINAEDDYLYVDLTVQGPVENSSDILINAGDDVMTVAIEDGDAEIDTEAWNEVGGSYSYYINLIEEGPVKNSAGVDITAGHDVGVVSLYDSWANIGARAWNESSVLPGDFPDTKDNVATVNINAGGGVGVFAEYSSEAQIGAGAEFATTNTAEVAIDAVGPVEVEARDGSQANIIASTMTSIKSNTSDIEINAEHVNVIAETESNSAINAEAYSAYDEENSENKANVAVYTHAADVESDEDSGDVLVEATMGSGASIEAQTMNANTNTSDVLVCADGDVQIYGTMGDEEHAAHVLANAMNAYSNTAKVRVGARGDEGVVVRADDGTAFIESWAQYGYTNTAETIVCTKGGVQVVDLGGPQVDTAGIIAEALNGNHTDAYVGICAQDDVIVAAGIAPEDFGKEIYGTGGHAMIKAEASSNSQGNEGDPPTANAEVAVISHNGGVAVIDVTGTEQARTAEITSSASGGYTNTAYTGVSAGGDLLNEEHPLYEEIQGTGVLVKGIGYNSDAKIKSETYDGYINTSDTVVCTPSEVVVQADGYLSVAEIGAVAEGDGFNAATTQVYAGDVYVYIPDYSGKGGIWANAWGWPIVPFLGDQEFILTDYVGEYGYHDLVWVEGGGVEDDDIATLRIGDYSKRQDCPECPVCPCEKPIKPTPTPKKPKPMGLFIPAAPLPERLSFEISGYPALMSWVAKELGVDTGSIQIGVTNSLASAKDIQPFRRFTRLRAAAMILQDAGGAYINALAQVVFEYASSTTPPTEEQMASIADAIARNAGANNQYALAGKYLDALAEYVGILSDEMGFAKEQAVQMVIERYVNRLTDSDNPAVAAYLAARLAAMGG